jgi:RNA polymerase sigma factor (sigma-70 family)
MSTTTPAGQRRPKQPDGGDFARLYAAEYAAMVRMAALLVGSASLAEEIVQESAIAVRQRWSHLDRPGAYLRTAVVNKCAATLRRRAVEQRFERTLLVPQPAVFPSELSELRDALDCLTERQRAVVVLRYFVDIHDDEIADLMGIRPSTVRSLTRRALTTLRKELA